MTSCDISSAAGTNRADASACCNDAITILLAHRDAPNAVVSRDTTQNAALDGQRLPHFQDRQTNPV
jgi:hypothetical protein